MSKPFKPAPGLGARLLQLRADRSREEFADLLGWSAASVGNYERGDRKMDAEMLALVAGKTGVDLNWLVTGEAGAAQPSDDDRIAIPRYAISASAGDGLTVLSEDVADYFMMSREWIRRFCPPGARLGLIEARGDSMETAIRDGDGLIIRFDIGHQDVREGGIFVLDYNGALLVKRLQILLDGTVHIIADNPSYRSEELTADQADQLLKVRAKVILNITPPRGG